MLMAQVLLKEAHVPTQVPLSELVASGAYDRVNQDVARHVGAPLPGSNIQMMPIRAVSPGAWVNTEVLLQMLADSGHTLLGVRELLVLGIQVPILQRSHLIVCLGEEIWTPETPMSPIQRFANLWGTRDERGLGVIDASPEFEWRPDDLFLVA